MIARLTSGEIEGVEELIAIGAGPYGAEFAALSPDAQTAVYRRRQRARHRAAAAVVAWATREINAELWPAARRAIFGALHLQHTVIAVRAADGIQVDAAAIGLIEVQRGPAPGCAARLCIALRGAGFGPPVPPWADLALCRLCDGSWRPIELQDGLRSCAAESPDRISERLTG